VSGDSSVTLGSLAVPKLEELTLSLLSCPRSHVCWHAFGLLHRSDRNYNEAVKAYKGALRIDQQNVQILKDMALLQIQMRDLQGFEQTRNTLLTLNPNAKINWMALVVAKHMVGDLTGAVKLIDIYLGTLTEDSEELGRCLESSELALYKNRILAEIPDNHKNALDHLATCEGIVLDRGAWLLYKAEYQLKLRDFAGAKHAVIALFDRGMTENHRVHTMYMCAVLKVDDALCDEALKLRGTRTLATLLPLSPDQKYLIRQGYESELLPNYPQSYTMYQIPLSLLDGDELESALDKLARRHLSKGVPSLCDELRSFLWIEQSGRLVQAVDAVDIRQHSLFQMYVSLTDQYVASLASCSKFAAHDDVDAPPSTLLWAWYLRAGLHELVSEYAEALSVLDKCIESAPTVVEVYELKARILKRSGDWLGAVEVVDKGRQLDLQDRYMNNQTTRYMLQAGLDERALEIISLFAKHEGNPEQNLYDMQCSWYELEVAACHLRKGNYGKSLKKYGKSVGRILAEFRTSILTFVCYLCQRRL
jgi:tetratricopeptide (TPR) repeat protein